MTFERSRAGTQRSDAGFGLLEVLVALVLISIGILSVSNILTQSVAMQTITAQRGSALSIAQTAMEDIRAMQPAAVTAQAAVAVNEDGSPAPGGVFTREVTVTSVDDTLIEVTVIVTSPRSSPVRLVTWIYDGET